MYTTTRVVGMEVENEDEQNDEQRKKMTFEVCAKKKVK